MSECIDHGKTKSLTPEGYALVGRPGVRSRCVRLHRLVLAEKLSTDLEGIKGVVARHTCDNPRCINPAHIVPGTIADNNRDRAERGRSAKSVPSRQRLTADDCEAIRLLHQPRVCGVTHLAKRFGVDTNVIYRVLKGEYPCPA